MNCHEFLERFSDYRDRDEGDVDVGPFEAHLEECASCRRYRDVVDRGVELARSFPGPGPRDDFTERLRHRIYHADLTEGRVRRDGLSPFITVAFAAAAVLVGVGAWGPISSVTAPRAVELPGISAAQPPAAVDAEPYVEGRTAPEVRNPPAFLANSDLWSQSHILLYEHSTLYHRNRGSLIQTGLH